MRAPHSERQRGSLGMRFVLPLPSYRPTALPPYRLPLSANCCAPPPRVCCSSLEVLPWSHLVPEKHMPRVPSARRCLFIAGALLLSACADSGVTSPPADD